MLSIDTEISTFKLKSFSVLTNLIKFESPTISEVSKFCFNEKIKTCFRTGFELKKCFIFKI